MKIEKLAAGMTVFDVGRTKMGNTTLKTVSVWPVFIESVDLEKRTVKARWNGNAAKTFHEHNWKKWRETQPLLVGSLFGPKRLATREEIAEHKAKTKGNAP